MSRKPTKGYYVKGHFVAQGSELDLELQREVKGHDLISKTDLKQKSNELQKLGEDLLDLRTDLMQQLLTLGHLPDLLHEAVAQAKKITISRASAVKCNTWASSCASSTASRCRPCVTP